jgi:hypothetical protein
MSVKQLKDGTWLIESGKDLQAAVEMVEQRESDIEDIERDMEEQYDYMTMKEEVGGLNAAITKFMSANDVKHVFRDTYKITVIRGHTTTWNPDRLKKLLPKSLWLKVTKQVVDPNKIDDLVKKGVIKDKLIEDALESKPKAAYIQRYPYKEGQDADAARAEEQALRQQLSRETVAEAPKPKKRKGSK